VLCVRDMYIQRCRHSPWHTHKQILKQTLMYVKVSIIMVCNQHVPDPNKHEQTPSQFGRDCFSVCFLFVCWYKTPKSLRRLQPWARSKTPGSVSTHVAYLFLQSCQRSVFFYYMFCCHTARAPITSGTITFLRCYADTQLALEVQQECTQVVCGNKEARKRLTDRSNPFPQLILNSELIMFVGIVVCACSRHALSLKMLFFRSFVSRKGFCVTSVTEVSVVLFFPSIFFWLLCRHTAGTPSTAGVATGGVQ